MGAENSKPSSEVKQHVFSTYVVLGTFNGCCACRSVNQHVTYGC